jgi:hypothetical protein
VAADWLWKHLETRRITLMMAAHVFLVSMLSMAAIVFLVSSCDALQVGP